MAKNVSIFALVFTVEINKIHMILCLFLCERVRKRMSSRSSGSMVFTSVARAYRNHNVSASSILPVCALFVLSWLRFVPCAQIGQRGSGVVQ